VFQIIIKGHYILQKIPLCIFRFEGGHTNIFRLYSILYYYVFMNSHHITKLVFFLQFLKIHDIL